MTKICTLITKDVLRDADLAFRIDPPTNYETTNLFIVYPLYLFFGDRYNFVYLIIEN